MPKTPSKHERNLRYLARARAYFDAAHKLLHEAGVSISQLEIGPSSEAAMIRYGHTNHAMRDLEGELNTLERVVCS